MYHVTDYHAARKKMLTAPLTLTEHDFSVLESFNPADEVRGRAAQRQAQIDVVTKGTEPSVKYTRHVPSPHVPSPSQQPATTGMRPERLAEMIVQGLRPVFASYREAIKDLKGEVQALKAQHAEIQKSFLDTRQVVQLLELRRTESRLDTTRGDIRH